MSRKFGCSGIFLDSLHCVRHHNSRIHLNPQETIEFCPFPGARDDVCVQTDNPPHCGFWDRWEHFQHNHTQVVFVISVKALAKNNCKDD